MRRLAIAATLFVATVVPLLATTMAGLTDPGGATDRAPMAPDAVALVFALSGVILAAGLVVAWRAERHHRRLRSPAD